MTLPHMAQTFATGSMTPKEIMIQSWYLHILGTNYLRVFGFKIVKGGSKSLWEGIVILSLMFGDITTKLGRFISGGIWTISTIMG